jgi:hypothetical protein
MYVLVLLLTALMCWIIPHEVIATMVIDGILPHFNLLVMGNELKQDMIEAIPRLLSKSV